jgi:hypothetical protein
LKRLNYFLAATAALGLVGCGGGGSNGNGGNSGADVETQIVAGQTSLSAVYVDAGTPGEITANFNAALTSFDAAATAAPEDPRAAVGFAIARAGITAQSLEATFGVEPDGDFSVGTPVENVASSLNIVNPNLNLLFWARPFDLDEMLPVVLPMDSLDYPAIDRHPLETAQALTAAEAQLGSALEKLTDAHLNALDAAPLQVQIRDDGTVKTVKIGTAEGYAMRSVLKAARGFCNAAIAYNFDTGNFHLDNPFLATFNTPLATSGGVGPSTYLPLNGFLTLTSTGAARMQAYSANWVGGADDALAATHRVRARTTTGWLTDSMEINGAQLDTVDTAIGRLKAIMTSPQDIPVVNSKGVTGTVTINIPAWTDGTPPADLEVFFPNLRGVPDDLGDTLVWPIAGSIEDRTFEGLFPNGVSEALLYDRDFLLRDEDPTTNETIALWAFEFFNPLPVG